MYPLLKQLGYKPYEKYSNIMVMGVVFAAIIGGVSVPFQGTSLAIIMAYSAISGAGVDFVKYMCFMIPMGILLIKELILPIATKSCCKMRKKDDASHKCSKWL